MRAALAKIWETHATGVLPFILTQFVDVVLPTKLLLNNLTGYVHLLTAGAGDKPAVVGCMARWCVQRLHPVLFSPSSGKGVLDLAASKGQNMRARETPVRSKALFDHTYYAQTRS